MDDKASNDLLEVLVNRLLEDDDLTAADFASLDNALQDRIDAQATYVDFVILDELLKNTFLEVSETLNHTILELLTQSAVLDDKPADEAEGTTKQPSAPAAVAKSVSPVLGLLGRFPISIMRPIVWSTALVAILSYGGFTIIAWNLRSKKLPSTTGGHDAIVALINDTNAVQWSLKTSFNFKAAKSAIRRGEPLSINAGTVEVELNAGTKLVIEGPAEWSIDGENRATLRSGKLAAEVAPRAVGFILDTPTARIVDLGTEFGVEIAEGDVTEVQVFKGKVELHSSADNTEKLFAKDPITLQAGHGIRIEPNGASRQMTTRPIAVMPHHFKRQIRPSSSGQLKVSGSLASSEWPLCPVRHLTDGSGLHGDRHEADARSTMWMTMPGTGKNAFVLFDLGSACRLESMKIWNYNDNYKDLAFHKTRGVKQADIYVSLTGDPDPLSHPEKWKLVVKDCQLSMAHGTDDYASPDLIPLANVETRFVAIVAKEQFDTVRDAEQTVGLSEVQFFGEKIVPTRSTAK